MIAFIIIALFSALEQTHSLTHLSSWLVTGDSACLSGSKNCPDGGPTVCKVGGVNYCCPGEFMSLVWNYGTVESCSCKSGQGTGYSCGGTGGSGNSASVTSASWLTCALASVVVVALVLRKECL